MRLIKGSAQVELWVDESTEVANLAAEVDGIEGLPGEDEEIENGGIENPGRRKYQSRETCDKAYSGNAKCIHDGRNSEQALYAVENELVALPPSVPIERGDQEENCGESESIKNHHAVDLHGGGEAWRKVFDANERRKERCVQKFQGIDAEENETKKPGVEQDGPAIREAVAAKKNVVRIPDVDQHQKADGGSGECGRGRAKVAETSRDGERDDEENKSDAEDDVAENV